jgi:hypothetical protein
MNAGKQLIYYVIAPDPGGRLPRQLAQSLRSLRRFNPEIAVHLLHCGEVSQQIEEESERNQVTVHQVPEYINLLENYAPGLDSLRAFPTLHKFLCLDRLPLDDVEQLLYMDCDTYWFADPATLFRRYRTNHFYACAEVGSRAFGNWYDPSYLDEDRVAALSSALGLAVLPPFNTGIMLMHTMMCSRLLALRPWFLETAARLLAGATAASATGEQVGTLAALPYPSSNTWLLDEVALWLTLGAIPGLQMGLFAQNEVPISNLQAVLPAEDRLVAHYFSIQEDDFFRLFPRL